MADDENTEPAEPGEAKPAPAGAAEPGVEPTIGAETTPGVTSTPSPSEPAVPGAEEAEPAAEPEPAPKPAAEEPEASPAAEAEPEPEPEPVVEPDPADERFDDLLLQLERVNLRLDELSRLGARQVEHIDRLHADNQQLRAGELRQALAPLVRALVRHHDDVAKLADSAAASSEAKVLEIARSGVLKVLVTAGVEAFEPEPGDRFDPSRHQGVGRTETADADLDGTIATVRRCGFVADDGRIVRPAEVEVYRLA